MVHEKSCLKCKNNDNNVQQFVKTTTFSFSFHILFSPFFPIPKSKIRRIMGKNGNFFYFENRKLFPSLFIYFFPILAYFSIPKSKFRCVLGKMGSDPPHPPSIHTCKLRGNFVNKNKNKCVSDNNPFTGKRMGIGETHQFQTAFITHTLKIFGQKFHWTTKKHLFSANWTGVCVSN